jgi:hypothetical protein
LSLQPTSAPPSGWPDTPPLGVSAAAVASFDCVGEKPRPSAAEAAALAHSVSHDGRRASGERRAEGASAPARISLTAIGVCSGGLGQKGGRPASGARVGCRAPGVGRPHRTTESTSSVPDRKRNGDLAVVAARLGSAGGPTVGRQKPIGRRSRKGPIGSGVLRLRGFEPLRGSSGTGPSGSRPVSSGPW